MSRTDQAPSLAPQRLDEAEDNTRSPPSLANASQPDQPREWLINGDMARLRDADLLAVCLRTGSSSQSLFELAQCLLEHFGSLRQVLQAPAEVLLGWPGLGAAKVAALRAVLGLAERVANEQLADGPVFTSSAAVQRFLRLKIGVLPREVFACLFLDTRHRLLRFEVLFQGTIDCANVHPRELVKRALETNAAAVILAHNHPSGVAEPSLADIALAERLQPLLREVGVRLLDHMVIGRGQEVSMAARGLLGPGA